MIYSVILCAIGASICKAAGGMTIFANGRERQQTIAVDVGPDATVQDIINDISLQTGVQREFVSVFYEGQPLADAEITIADAEIPAESTIEYSTNIRLSADSVGYRGCTLDEISESCFEIPYGGDVLDIVSQETHERLSRMTRSRPDWNITESTPITIQFTASPCNPVYRNETSDVGNTCVLRENQVLRLQTNQIARRPNHWHHRARDGLEIDRRNPTYTFRVRSPASFRDLSDVVENRNITMRRECRGNHWDRITVRITIPGELDASFCDADQQ